MKQLVLNPYAPHLNDPYQCQGDRMAQAASTYRLMASVWWYLADGIVLCDVAMLRAMCWRADVVENGRDHQVGRTY